MFPSFISFSKLMVTHDYIHLLCSPKHPKLQNMTPFVCFVGVIFLRVKDKMLDSIKEHGRVLIAKNEYFVVPFTKRLLDNRKVNFCYLFKFMVLWG